MHAMFVAVGLWLLLRPRCARHRAVFLLLYCFVAINLAELTAYLLMRPFIPNGDTGRFQEGLKISPFVLFAAGNLGLLIAFYIFARKVGPRIVLVAQGSALTRWLLVLAAGFLMFLWGSGLRMMLLFPDPQWTAGLVGIPALLGWLAANSLDPRMATGLATRESA